MRKILVGLRFYVIGLLLIVIIAFIFLEYACRQREGKYSAYSIDKETAIEEGFYIASYSPLTKKLQIPNTKDTVLFNSAWTEHTWEMSKGLCLFRNKVHGEGYNFCLTFSTVASDINSYPFQLKSLDDTSIDFGSFSDNRYNFGLSKLNDTIRLVISQNESDTVKAKVFSDTLLFIVKRNGS